MRFLRKFFSAPPQEESLIAVVHRLLDENRELRQELVKVLKPEPVVVYKDEPLVDTDDKKPHPTISGWVPPRQRVRKLINSTNPATSLLSEDEMRFLEQNRN